MQIRNLTPVVAVPVMVGGVLDEVFVSQDQLVQKGELLGAVKADAIRLDIVETQRDLALKILERHCFIMLKENRLGHSLPQASALMVDQTVGHENFVKKLTQCQKQQLRTQTKNQSLEEMIAALEDQSRLLETVVKVRNAIEPARNGLRNDDTQLDADYVFPFGGDQSTLQKAYRDQYFPMMRLAQVQQELRGARAEYFSRKVQIEEDLTAAIKLAEQEIRYLDERLRQLGKQLENTFIYASITGKVVASERTKVGMLFKKHETVFELLPLKSDFQVSISLEDKDSHRFEVGTTASVYLENGNNRYGPIEAITAAVLRKADGKLEAILNLDGNASENAKAILASGYIGQGQQRLRGSITSGEDKIWQAVVSAFPININK